MNRIHALLHRIEKEKGLRIVFAVESGSREWGMASQDSDYDVRGVFCYPPQRYFDLSRYAEDITLFRGDIDVHLMELRKFTDLLLNSNPTCVEWLQSKTWYIGAIPKVFGDFLKGSWSPVALCHHYSGLCRQNYLKYLKTRHEPTVKRYLYACRGWLAGLIARKGVLPPIHMHELIKKAPITRSQRERLEVLISAKKKGNERMMAPKLPEFDVWLEKFIRLKITQGKRKTINVDPFREYVRTEIEKTSLRARL